MKNWEPFVFGPELAIDKIPLLLCIKWPFLNSSWNFPPHIDSPPVPVPEGSPP